MNKLDELFRFSLVSVGVLYLINRSVIFSWPRMFISRHGGPWLTALIYCPSCLGFWVGAALCPLWPWHTTAYVVHSALALCGLGSVLGTIWETQVVQRELEMLGVDFSRDEDKHGGSPKEE